VRLLLQHLKLKSICVARKTIKKGDGEGGPQGRQQNSHNQQGCGDE